MITASGPPERERRRSRARWRCHTCGAVFTAWAPAERHGWAVGHHRIEWLWQ